MRRTQCSKTTKCLYENTPLSKRTSVPKQLTQCNALERMTVIVVVHSRDRYNISNFPLSISYSRYIRPRLLGVAQINFTTCSQHFFLGGYNCLIQWTARNSKIVYFYSTRWVNLYSTRWSVKIKYNGKRQGLNLCPSARHRPVVADV